MTSSIANETVDHSKNREPFSFYKFITNKYFLNVVSIVLFLALWDYVAKEKIFRDSLARPLEVVDQLYRLTYMKFAGTNLIGHIWASTQRVLIGFIAASVVAVPLGLFMALNKYVNAIVKPLFDLFKPMPPIAWVSIAILWFGIGEMSKVFIIIIGTFVPCLLNAYNGVRLVDPDLYDVIRVLGGKRREIGALFLQHVQKRAVSVLAEKVERELLILPAGCRRARECERLGSAEPEVCELHLAEAVLHGLSVFAEPDMRVGAHALECFDIGRVRFDLREARKKLCAAVTELREKMIA